MPGFLVPALFAAGSGIASVISGGAQARQQRDNIRSSQAMLRENLIDEEELDKYIRNINMSFNSSLANIANQGAIKSRGIANQGVVAAAAAAPLESGRIREIANVEQRAEDVNRQTQSQIAGLERGIPGNDPVGDFIGGAIPGLTAGLEFQKFMGYGAGDTPGDGDDKAGDANNGQGTDGGDIRAISSAFGLSSKPNEGYDNPYQFRFNNKFTNTFSGRVSNPTLDYLGDDQSQYSFFNKNRFRF